MRVVKPRPKPKKRRVICRHCKAVIECVRGELRYEHDARDGDALVLTCPECNGETWIAEELMR